MRVCVTHFVARVDGVKVDASCPRRFCSRRWGGNLELVAAANLRSVNVVVHQLEAPKFEICADDNSATRTVHLSYPVWISTSELGYIAQTPRRLKFEFHTGRTTARRTITPCG